MRTTKRYAPAGYTYVDKPLAERLYNSGATVTMHGNNVSYYHVFGGWSLGCTLNKKEVESRTGTPELHQFADLCIDMLYYMDSELGTYLVFCVPTDQLNDRTKDKQMSQPTDKTERIYTRINPNNIGKAFQAITANGTVIAEFDSLDALGRYIRRVNKKNGYPIAPR